MQPLKATVDMHFNTDYLGGINLAHAGLGSASNYVSAGADPELYRGGWLSGWLPILYHTEPLGWLASNDQLIPIISCINKQVKGGG